MQEVVAHAEPTKLELALSTRHMHAALILLNCVFAFGACLGVELDPVLGVLLAPADAVQPLV